MMIKETPLTPAQSLLAEQNRKLVPSIARKYIGNNILFEDLCGEGYLALCIAARNYRKSDKNSFSTYASKCIDSQLKEYVFKTDAENDFLASLTKDDLYSTADLIDEYTEEDFFKRISVLSEQEQYIIKSFIGIGAPKKTKTELATELDVNRHTIGKIIKNVQDKLCNE